MHESNDDFFCVVSKLNFKFHQALIIFLGGENRDLENLNISQANNPT